MLRPDTWIRRMALEQRMIEPFVEHTAAPQTLSYGLTPYGYDVRLAGDFHLFVFGSDRLSDPKRFDPKYLKQHKADALAIPPNGFALAHTVEFFRLPGDISATPVGKLAYTRVGLLVVPTLLEPCWEGYMVIQLANLSPVPVKVYAGEGIASVGFYQNEAPRLNASLRRRNVYVYGSLKPMHV